MMEKKELSFDELENVTGGVLSDSERETFIEILNNYDSIEEVVDYYQDLYVRRNEPGNDEAEYIPLLENYLRNKGYIVENGRATRI